MAAGMRLRNNIVRVERRKLNRCNGSSKLMLKSGGEHGVELEDLPPGSCAGDRLARKVSSLTQASDQGLQIHRVPTTNGLISNLATQSNC